MSATAHQAITSNIVKDVAEELMESNGQTTTLEVKKELRKRGYWAKQKEVSDLMFSLSDTEDWDVQNDPTGTHRVYSDDGAPNAGASHLFTVNSGGSSPAPSSPSASRIPSSLGSSRRSRRKLQAPSNVATGDKCYTRQDGQVVHAHEDKSHFLGQVCWTVKSTQSSEVLFFDKSYPRDMVRGAYRGLVGVSIQSTRASRS